MENAIVGHLRLIPGSTISPFVPLPDYLAGYHSGPVHLARSHYVELLFALGTESCALEIQGSWFQCFSASFSFSFPLKILSNLHTCHGA